MKKTLLLVLGLCMIFSIVSCGQGNTDSTDNPPAATSISSLPDSYASTVEEIKIDSAEIATNKDKEPSERTVYVYLPPSYSHTEKEYPVVYFLHGYQDSPRNFMDTYQAAFDKEFKAGKSEFILVALDGNTQSGGSFYVNSTVSGNWENYVVSELVSTIDSKYRTIADAKSRGISGYSMGGFGALNLSMKHPDVFSSVMVFCPGVFAEGDLGMVLDSWSSSQDVQISYAKAFSPDITDAAVGGNIITRDDITAKNQVYTDWINGFSGWEKKLDTYLSVGKSLKAISINYSKDDWYAWIPNGCVYLDDFMNQKSMAHDFKEFSGGHIVPTDAAENYFVPFFGENLAFSS